MKSKRQFGELESLVLQILKKRKRATVGDIHKDLDEKVAYTTVMTVMQRLFEKSVLDRKKIGKSYQYWFSKKGVNNFLKIVENIKTKFFFGKSSEMVSYLIENDANITKDEIEKIEDLINKAKKRL